jgi:6-phosphogluconolactonase (cycloisomerase 2 family)
MVWRTPKVRYLAALALIITGVCSWTTLSGSASAQNAADTTATAPTLTPVPGPPFFSTGTTNQDSSVSLSYSPNGDLLAVADRFGNGTGAGALSMLSVSNTGALTPVTDSPFATPADPSDAVFDPDGQYLAVANATDMLGNSLCSACVSMYSVASDGTPTLITGSTAAGYDTDSQIEDIAFAPDGNVLVAATPSAILSFSVAGNGDLSLVSNIDLPDSEYATGNISVSPDGKLVAITDTGSNVELYSLSGSTLTYLNSTPSGTTPMGLAFSPSGDLLAVANRDSGNTSMFTVGAGGLTPVTGSPFTDTDPRDDDPVAVAFNPAGWLAVLGGDAYLTTFTVEADGALQEPGTVDDDAIGNEPTTLVFSPSGQFLDALDYAYGDIYAFAGLAPPAATIKTPAGGGTYTVGEKVPTSFSCADSTGAPGIASCTDSNGATNGVGALNTSAPGTDTYTVTAVSQDGLSSTAKITYTVSGAATTTTSTSSTTATTTTTTTTTQTPAPPATGGPVTVSGTTASTTLSCKGTPAQTCSLTVSATVLETLSGSKVLGVTASAKKKPKTTKKTVVIGTVSVKLKGGTKKTVKLTLNKAGKALVDKHHSLKAQIKITEGKTVLRSQRVTFKQPKHKPRR